MRFSSQNTLKSKQLKEVFLSKAGEEQLQKVAGEGKFPNEQGYSKTMGFLSY